MLYECEPGTAAECCIREWYAPPRRLHFVARAFGDRKKNAAMRSLKPTQRGRSPRGAGNLCVARYSAVSPSLNRSRRLAARFFNVPIALLSLIDADRLWFKSTYGLDVSEVPRDGDVLRLHDPAEPPVDRPGCRRRRTFCRTILIVAGPPHVRFYAGAPLTTKDGSNLGDALSDRHRTPQTSALPTPIPSRNLAAIAMAAIEARRTEERLRRQIALNEQTTGALRLGGSQVPTHGEEYPGPGLPIHSAGGWPGGFSFYQRGLPDHLGVGAYAQLQEDAARVFRPHSPGRSG